MSDPISSPPSSPDSQRTDSHESVRPNMPERHKNISSVLLLPLLKLFSDNLWVLIPLLGSPLFFGCVELIFAFQIGKNVFTYTHGNFFDSLVSYSFLGVNSILSGGFSMILANRSAFRMEQINKDKRTSRLVYLVRGYVFAIFYSLVPAAVLLAVRYFYYESQLQQYDYVNLFITIYLLNLCGILVGWIVTIITSSPVRRSLSMIGIILVFLLLANPVGLMKPIRYFSPLYWGIKNFVAISGIGSDLVDNPCWNFPKDLRRKLSPDLVQHLNCDCTNLAIFSPETCNLPGMGTFFHPNLNAPEPFPPVHPGNPPAELILPEPPTPPITLTNQVEKDLYDIKLQIWEEETNKLQNEYELMMLSYQLRKDIYKNQYEEYQTTLNEWQLSRSNAIESAESMIIQVNQNFNWAFSNHRIMDIRKTLVKGWAANLVIIIILLFFVILQTKKHSAIQ